MLTAILRNDFLLKDSKQQDCPERETQVASDLIVPSEMKQHCGVEFMTDARIFTGPGFSVKRVWKDISE